MFLPNLIAIYRIILLKTTNLNLMVLPAKEPEDQQSYQDALSGKHECLNKILQHLIQ